MIRLCCAIQQYDWGKHGYDSVVGKLKKKSDDTINLIGPYAELWMGTHPSGPSKIKESQDLLSLYLNINVMNLQEFRLGNSLVK